MCRLKGGRERKRKGNKRTGQKPAVSDRWPCGVEASGRHCLKQVHDWASLPELQDSRWSETAALTEEAAFPSACWLVAFFGAGGPEATAHRRDTSLLLDRADRCGHGPLYGHLGGGDEPSAEPPFDNFLSFFGLIVFGARFIHRSLFPSLRPSGPSARMQQAHTHAFSLSLAQAHIQLRD